MKLVLLLPIIGLLTSCTSAINEGNGSKPTVTKSVAVESSYFSFQNDKEYTISNKDRTIILDFVASSGTPTIRYAIDNGAWYKIADANCTAFRVHVVIEKGRTCTIVNDTDLYVSGHFEHPLP